MNTAPKDICRHITVFLNLRDCRNLFFLNKHWNQLAKDVRFWQKRLELDFNQVEQQSTLCLKLYKEEMAILRRVRAPSLSIDMCCVHHDDFRGSYEASKFVDDTVCLNLNWNGVFGPTVDGSDSDAADSQAGLKRPLSNWELILTAVLRSHLQSKDLMVDILKCLAYNKGFFDGNIVLTDINFSPGLRLVRRNAKITLTLYIDQIFDRICSKYKSGAQPHKSISTSAINHSSFWTYRYFIGSAVTIGLLGLSYFGCKKYMGTNIFRLETID